MSSRIRELGREIADVWRELQALNGMVFRPDHVERRRLELKVKIHELAAEKYRLERSKYDAISRHETTQSQTK